MGGGERGAQRGQRIEGQLGAERVGERAQDRPVLARVARREHRALGELRPALGVDVDAGLLGIGGARQDDVGAMRAAIAMRAEIDDEGAGRDVDLVGAEIEEHIERAGFGHRRRVEPALAPARSRDRGRRRARPRVCSTLKPFQPSLTTPSDSAALAASDSTAAPSGRAKRAGAEDEHRLRLVGGRMVGEARRARPARRRDNCSRRSGRPSADDADQAIALQPALADARVEHRRFEARIGADDHDRVGLVDAGDRSN